MVYDNEMKDRVEQIKKDLEEEKAAHAATLYEAAKLRETLDEIGYKPLSVIKNEARRQGWEQCHRQVNNLLNEAACGLLTMEQFDKAIASMEYKGVEK